MAMRRTRRGLGLASWWPTRKWMAATVIAVGGILATLATTGWDFTPEMNGALITILTQRVVAYLLPNDDSPGSVPRR